MDESVRTTGPTTPGRRLRRRRPSVATPRHATPEPPVRLVAGRTRVPAGHAEPATVTPPPVAATGVAPTGRRPPVCRAGRPAPPVGVRDGRRRGPGRPRRAGGRRPRTRCGRPGPPPRPVAGTGPRGARGWIVVAVVAALIGGAAGAGHRRSGRDRQQHQLGPRRSRWGRRRPGPALAGGAQIPTIVKSVLPEVVSIDAKGPGTGRRGLFGGGPSRTRARG